MKLKAASSILSYFATIALACNLSIACNLVLLFISNKEYSSSSSLVEFILYKSS